MSELQKYKAVIITNGDNRAATMMPDSKGRWLFDEDVEETEMLGMARGTVMAAAEACRTFDQPVIAQHILESAGITDAELELCADYDLKALREAGLTEVESNL